MSTTKTVGIDSSYDRDTGEITSQTIRTRKYERETAYSKMDSEHLWFLLKLSGRQLKMLLAMVKLMDKENICFISHERRVSISEQIGVDVKTISLHLSELCETGAAFKVESKIYFINPYLFSKDSLPKTIKLRMLVSYINGNFEYKKNK